jgi:hypothetical protein
VLHAFFTISLRDNAVPINCYGSCTLSVYFFNFFMVDRDNTGDGKTSLNKALRDTASLVVPNIYVHIQSITFAFNLMPVSLRFSLCMP